MTRGDFVESVRHIFHEAGVEFAFLHGFEEWDRDSDIDIVVSRASLKPVDSLIRTGALGGLVQRVDYDVPWCRAYLLDTRSPDRRFRQLDVACDPLGISRHGQGLRDPLRGSVLKQGKPVVGPETRLVYLAAKRAYKGIRNQREVTLLQEAFDAADDGSGALGAAFGHAGRLLAEALIRPSPLDHALSLVAKSIRNHRNHPARLLLRGMFGTARALRRAVTPAGLVVAVVGPDGVGKSTLTTLLSTRTAEIFRDVHRLHLTPGLLPPPARLLRRPAYDVTLPHARAPSGRLGSILRTVYLATDTLVGWGPRVALPRIRANLVVIERGWRDLEIDPVRYRLAAGKPLIRLLTRLLPKPDLTLVLRAEAQVIHDRKPELSVVEISRQLAEWGSVTRAAPRRFIAVDTTDFTRAGEDALDAVVDRLMARSGSLEAYRAIIGAVGNPRRDADTAVAIVYSKGLPRWLLPVHRNAAGPVSARLYRPGSFRNAAGAALLEAWSRSGIRNNSLLTLDTSTGLIPELESLLELSQLELAAMLPTDASRPMRTVISVLHQRRSVAIAKLDADGSLELEREFHVLTQLAHCPMTHLQAPRVLGFFRWQGFQVLVMSSLPIRGRTDRRLGPTEERALADLRSLMSTLPGEAGSGSTLVHGDFCGWNTSRLGNGGLAVWDWEWARQGEPLEDWFHWQVRRALQFGHGSMSEVSQWALSPPPKLVRFANLVSTCPETAPMALAHALKADLRRLSHEPSGKAYQVRAEALARLMRG